MSYRQHTHVEYCRTRYCLLKNIPTKSSPAVAEASARARERAISKLTIKEVESLSSGS